MSLSVDGRGHVKRLRIGWRVPCDRAGSHYKAVSPIGFRRPASGVPTVRIFGHTHFHDRLPGGHADVVDHLRGARRSPYRWTGTIRPVVVVRRHGRVFDHCHGPVITWSATLPHLRARIHDGWTGTNFAYASPRWGSSVKGGREGVEVAFGPWRFEFGPPRGKLLHRGTYAPVIRYGRNVRKAGISLIHEDIQCEVSGGSFTLQAIAFDRHGRVRAFHVRFVERCEAGLHVSTGEIRWRRR